MAALWFEERAETSLWHLAVGEAGKARYRMACGSEFQLREVRRLWPAKPGEVGPPLEDRCHACV